MANIALGKLPIEKDAWERAEDATNGNSEKYTGQEGFAHAKHPCTYTLDLGKSASVWHVRFLLWDNLGTPEGTLDGRKYKYRLYTSTDAKKWEFVGGSPKDGTISWQDFEFQIPQKLRYVRLECLAGTSVPKLHLVEFEVHDEKPDPIKTRGPINHHFVEDRFIGVRQKVDELVSEISASTSSVEEMRKNSEAWSAKIQELYDLLSSEEENVKSLIEKNATALEQIQQIKSQFDEVSSKNNQAGELLKSLKGVEVEVHQAKDRLLGEEKSINDLIASIKAYSEGTFEPLKQEVQNLRNDVANGAANSKELVQQIQVALTGANELLSQIKANLDQSISKKAELDKTYNGIQALFEKATNSQDGIQARLDQINQLKGQIDTIAGNIQASYDKATSETKSISDNKKTSYEELDAIRGFHTKSKQLVGESETLKKNIGNILELVSDTGRANSWDKRRKRSQNATYLWIGVMLISVLVSFVLLAKLFLTEDGQNLFSGIDNEYIVFLLRLTLAGPGVFLIWFSAAQYSKERHFLEQYEFKTAAALAMESYTESLIRTFPEKVNETYNLTISLIRQVYKEPLYTKSKSRFAGKFKVPTASGEADIIIDNKGANSGANES